MEDLVNAGSHLFEVAGVGGARELHEADLPALQAFFDANPAYFQRVNGRDALPDEAHTEFHDRPPEGMAYSRVWVIGVFDRDGDLIAMASVLTDLMAVGVSHIGLFIVASRLHGQGQAHRFYEALEVWCQAQGAQWIRLGCVVGNAQAGRFWRRVGFELLKVRHGIDTGGRVNDVEVMFKPVTGLDREAYLSKVSRDRPDPT